VLYGRWIQKSSINYEKSNYLQGADATIKGRIKNQGGKMSAFQAAYTLNVVKFYKEFVITYYFSHSTKRNSY